MKSHLQSYPCPLQINSFWNLGFLLGITIILQIITGIFLGLHYTSDLNSEIIFPDSYLLSFHYCCLAQSWNREENHEPEGVTGRDSSSFGFCLSSFNQGLTNHTFGLTARSLFIALFLTA